MEPPQKRQRLLEPTAYSNDEDDELLGPYPDIAQDHGDEDDYEEFDDAEEGYDFDQSEAVPYEIGNRSPGSDLAERRTIAAQKLKSNWEKLFEKFSKDFSGIGDEIDLATGEIVVDNGHLKSMQDEQDIGPSIPGKTLLKTLTEEPLKAATIEPEGLSALSPGTEAAGNSIPTSQDEFEDAEIIRPSTEQDQENKLGNDFTTPQDLNTSETGTIILSRSNNLLPSREEILERFGALGPQVVQLLDQQQGNLNQASIEPVWRFPELPTQVSGERPVLRSVFLQEVDSDRSPSPERGISLWSSPTRKRRRRTSQQPTEPLDSMNKSPSVGSHSKFIQGRPRKKPQTFSDQDDEILLAAMTKAKQQGLNLFSQKIHDQIAIEHPHHSAKEWYDRWYRTRRQPKQGNSLTSSPSPGKEWKFDGFEWVPKDSEVQERRSDLQTSRKVGFLKRVYHTERIGPGNTQDTDLHIFMGVLISETNRERRTSGRIQELTSPELRSAGLSFQDVESDAKSLQLPRSRIPTQQPQRQITWKSSVCSKNSQTNSEDLFEKLKSVFARPVRSKHLSALQLLPREQHISVTEGDNEYHVRLVACPHPHCQKSAKLYKGSRINDGQKCEFVMHLKDDHDMSMYPCLEARCNRKGGNGFQIPGRLISHIKTEHDYKRAWSRLQRIIDTKTFASNGIHFDERTIDLDSISDAVDELQDESSGLGIQLRPPTDENSEPKRFLLGSSPKDYLPVDNQDNENLGSSLSSSRAKQLVTAARPVEDPEVLPDVVISENIEATLLESDAAELPTFDEEATTNVAVSSAPTSSPRNVPQLSFSDPPTLEELDSNPIIINSSPPSRSFGQNTYPGDLPLRVVKASANPIPSESSNPDHTTTSPSLPGPSTSPSKLSSKRFDVPFILAEPDSDDLDELSILSPSSATSFMTTHSLIKSRTPSRLSSPMSSIKAPPSTPKSHRINKSGRPRHSLPMSAIPSRTIQKTTRQSISGYNPPSPSKLRRSFMPVTPTRKTAKKGITSSFNSSLRKARDGSEMDDVLKTPGGTLRQCGRNGLSCGREFCFRCLSEVA